MSKEYTQEELKEILDLHAKWCLSSSEGNRANLKGANLISANLSGANIRWANLSDANLSEAYLIGANLRGANLRGADLRGANLSETNLRGANIRGTNLTGANLISANLSQAYFIGANLSEAYLIGANLRGADLKCANLIGANLSEAYLSGANLSGANLSGTILPAFQIVPDEGSFIAYKKVRATAYETTVLKLLIPEEAARTSTLVGRKCRSSKAVVLEGEGYSTHEGESFYYKAGETVYPDKYDPDIRVECTNGIHFFMTRGEAESY